MDSTAATRGADIPPEDVVVELRYLLVTVCWRLWASFYLETKFLRLWRATVLFVSYIIHCVLMVIVLGPCCPQAGSALLGLE